MPLYAAYGSNMHPEQMLQRAPHSPMAATGWLHGWRLTFAGADIGWEGALATLGYEGRRGQFFEQQLIAALKILQNGDVSVDGMTGS